MTSNGNKTPDIGQSVEEAELARLRAEMQMPFANAALLRREFDRVIDELQEAVTTGRHSDVDLLQQKAIKVLADLQEAVTALADEI
jgi:hypothetical protein